MKSLLGYNSIYSMRKFIKGTITICSSASFYKDVLDIEKRLNKLGFKVMIPSTAYKMKRNKNFDISVYKTWYKNPNHYKKKAKLMNDHFKKVMQADAILVINLDKNGTEGYIGGNGLMEMALAFHYNKPIFIYNNILNDNIFLEEILGMHPIFIQQDLSKISF